MKYVQAPLCPEAQQYLLHTEACSCNVCIEAKRGCEDCAQCILDRGTRVLVRDTTKEGFGFGFGVVLGIQPSAGSAGSGGSLVHVLKTMRPSALVPGDHITHMNDRPVADMSWAAIHALLCAADSTLRLRVSNAVGGAPLSAISHWYKPGTGVWLFVPAESGKPAVLLNRKTASALEDALATTTGTVTINLTPSTASAAAATAPAARVVHMGTLQVLDEPQGGSKVVIGRLVWGPARPVRPAKPAGLAESVQPPGDVAAAAARVEASCPWVQVTAVEQVQVRGTCLARASGFWKSTDLAFMALSFFFVPRKTGTCPVGHLCKSEGGGRGSGRPSQRQGVRVVSWGPCHPLQVVAGCDACWLILAQAVPGDGHHRSGDVVDDRLFGQSHVRACVRAQGKSAKGFFSTTKKFVVFLTRSYLSDVAPCVVNEGGCLLIVRVVCGHEFDGGTKDNVSMAGPPPLFDTVKVRPSSFSGKKRHQQGGLQSGCFLLFGTGGADVHWRLHRPAVRRVRLCPCGTLLQSVL